MYLQAIQTPNSQSPSGEPIEEIYAQLIRSNLHCHALRPTSQDTMNTLSVPCAAKREIEYSTVEYMPAIRPFCFLYADNAVLLPENLDAYVGNLLVLILFAICVSTFSS